MTANREAERASARIEAPLDVVRGVLLEPLALPEWNEAFRTIAGPPAATIGVGYRISVRGGLSGSFAYTAIDARRVGMSWAVPGFRETGAWLLQPAGADTVVTHEFEHSGPLAALLRPAYSGVARLRLERLASRVARTRSVDERRLR